jgi:hypothetical protein
MRLLLMLIAALTLTPTQSNDSAVVSESGDWQGESPDGKLFASLAIQPYTAMIWRKDFDDTLLEVADVDSTGNYNRYICFEIVDRIGLRALWSPDSRYLVITTASSGGHSPWHAVTYVYAADDRTLHLADDAVGLVISPDLKFTGPHTVELKIGVGDANGIDFEHPKTIEVDLDTKTPAMKKTLEPSEHGDLSAPAGN